MREPIYRVVNDDDPMDYEHPCAVSLATIRGNGETDLADDLSVLRVGASLTIGGGAAVQHTLTRIR